MLDFLRIIIELFNKSGIPYMISGSIAFNIYAIPRSTRDIDIIASFPKSKLDEFISLLDDNFYYSRTAMEDAIKRTSIFNIIHLESGFKLDVIVLKNQSYEIHKFNRRKTITFEGIKADFITPEDLVISKLSWIQEFESDIQKVDIRRLLQNDRIDIPYIKLWTNQLKLKTFNLLTDE